MVDYNKRQKLQEIFEIFDSDNDGQISAQRIDLQTLPTEVLEIFTPLLYEMEEIGQNLDRDEFVDASLRLFNVTILVFKVTLIDNKYSAKEFDSSIQENSKVEL